MRIAVLGSTGGTGKEVIRQALEKGWEVVALARNPAKLNGFTNDRLQVAKVDIFNADDLAKQFSGCEAVVSCLGVTGLFFPWSTVTILQDTVKVITLAMRQAQVQRLIVMSSWCTVSKEGNPAMIEWFIKPLFLRAPLKDMAVMEEYLAEQDEDIKWTSVKPPQLTDGPDTTEVIKAEEGEHVKDGHPAVQRGDVARFILRCLETGDWQRKKVSITV